MSETRLGSSSHQDTLAFQNDRQVNVELPQSLETIQTDSRVRSEQTREKVAIFMVVILPDESSGNR
jgi:hypothetical protein